MWAFGQNFPTQFEAQYNCSSTAMAGRDVDDGDKIFLPPSALDKLARMNVEYPMLFEISSDSVDKKTHCGVLEFSAEEGWCYMPFWMMENLVIDEGSLITVKNVSLSKATFVKFRAQSMDFVEVSNPRALLEVALRKFTCLTVGDTICIPYGSSKFYLDVREVQPNGAASIIETDCNVDFEEPLGYQDSKYAQYERDKQQQRSDSIVSNESSVSNCLGARTLQKARVETAEELAAASGKFSAFSGAAKRIDGKVSAQAKAAAAAGSESKSANSATESKSSDGFTASGAKSAGPGTTTAATAAAAPPVSSYQSRIGDKYSKKKTAASAFGGPARKLNS